MIDTGAGLSHYTLDLRRNKRAMRLTALWWMESRKDAHWVRRHRDVETSITALEHIGIIIVLVILFAKP